MDVVLKREGWVKNLWTSKMKTKFSTNVSFLWFMFLQASKLYSIFRQCNCCWMIYFTFCFFIILYFSYISYHFPNITKSRSLIRLLPFPVNFYYVFWLKTVNYSPKKLNLRYLTELWISLSTIIKYFFWKFKPSASYFVFCCRSKFCILPNIYDKGFSKKKIFNGF